MRGTITDAAPHVWARVPGGRIAHRLAAPGVAVTACGREARTMLTWPHLTQANSTDRRAWPVCPACDLVTR